MLTNRRERNGAGFGTGALSRSLGEGEDGTWVIPVNDILDQAGGLVLDEGSNPIQQNP